MKMVIYQLRRTQTITDKYRTTQIELFKQTSYNYITIGYNSSLHNCKKNDRTNWFPLGKN